METKNHFFSDFLQSSQSIVGILHEIKKEVDNMIQQKIKDYVHENSSIDNEKLQILQEMVTKARIEQEKINQRLDALEKKLNINT